MSELKNVIVKEASKEVVSYIYSKHGIEIDYLDIAEIINLNIRNYLNNIIDNMENVDG